jgi:DNA-binding response OmpR family regulator
MSKILVVDDEFRIRQIIRKYAEFEGYEVEEATDGMQAIQVCRQNEFDLIIMDVMMPELDGFSACREIRKFCDTPIIMLSARGEEYDKIHGFELGSDDYVVKPFSPKELMMRVGAVIKRSGKNSDSTQKDVFTYQGLEVDFSARTVSVDGSRVEMTPKEYDLFFYMVRNKGIALTRESLISEVWGYDFFGDERTLDTHIKLLRKSLGAYSRCIVTLRGVGYRFDTV